MSKYYLKPTIKAEPIIWRWYAWPHLIPPSTSACNIVERHIKIMQSYIRNPKIHAQAMKDPKMIGGPFIDLNGQQTEQIQELINFTNENCKALINLNNSLKEANKILQNEAKGNSLEDIYQRLPMQLRGFVELVYDLDNHPSLRLIEPLLYRVYYNNNHQEMILSNTTSDFRKFVLSTPRLDHDDELCLKIPFNDKRLDTLFKLKYQSCDLKEIISLLEVPEHKQNLFKSFFTTIAHKPNQDNNYNDGSIRIRYFGHACMLIQTKSTSILFDPVISYSIDNNTPRFTFDDLPDEIDYVIITHNHQDHIMFESLIQLRHKIKHIVFPATQKGSLADPSIKLILEQIGFTSLMELSELETISLLDGSITGLPFLGEHSDLNIQSKLSYFIEILGKKLIFAADSNNLDEFLYKHIYEITGSVDMIFLGMECDGAPLSWLYGPLLTTPLIRSFDHSRTLSGSNFNKAWSIIESLKCKHAYVYAMGQEPWLNYVMALSYSPQSIQIIESDRFVNACKEKGIESERLFGKKEWII